ncbi:hypothetical protein BZU93_26440 [Salmonella enterica subsp. enterica]|nr:hypothetical protein [Salmonella enterica subsp. enterica serovar Newport]ECF1263617.1 hypothetical protein [Salmonella enterica subsp. enterica serovar Uganda]MIL09398.1 hypothetical protein [Salmonella enterica subsp. enterica serovar Enteritidis]
MHTATLKAGLAATFITLSSISAFADRAPPVVIEEPHLGTVLDQVQAAVDGIKMENKDHNLTTAQTAQLDKQAGAIRRDAEMAAKDNRGRIPSPTYHALLDRISKLNIASNATPPNDSDKG